MGVIQPECVRVLEGHSGAVLNLKFTLNGAYCLSTSQDKSVILWNPIKGLAIKVYKGHHNHEVNDVSVTTDNSKFATCGGDQSAFLWDVTSGEVIRKFSGHEGKINCCEIAGDNGLLFTGSYDKCVRIWDMKAAAYKPIQTLREAKDSISSIIVTSENRLLTTSVDGCLRVYDVRAGRLHTDKLPSPAVRSTLTHDERCIAVNCLDNTIQFLEVDSGQHLKVYRGHKNSNYSINSQFDITDSYIVSGSEDGRIVVWEISETAAQGKTADDPIQELSVQTTTLASSRSDGSAVPASSSSAGWGCVFTVRFHPTQRLLLSCHNDARIRVWRQHEK